MADSLYPGQDGRGSLARSALDCRSKDVDEFVALGLLTPETQVHGDVWGANQREARFTVKALAKTPLLIYHHQTRCKGGASVEFHAVSEKLRDQATVNGVCAIRFRPYSSRFDFLINATALLEERLAHFASVWGLEVELSN